MTKPNFIAPKKGSPHEGSKKTWWVVSDGACSGNPGPGGWGLILKSPDGIVEEFCERHEHTTNNRMEILGMLEGLLKIEQAEKDSARICVVTDSSYVVKSFEQYLASWIQRNWMTAAGQPVANQDLWTQVQAIKARLLDRGFDFQMKLVKGHAAIESNERADVLAVSAAQNQAPTLYHGPESAYSISFSLEARQVFYLSFVDGVLLRHTTWDECSKVTHGKKGAKFKKISSRQEELETLQLWGVE